MRVPGKPIMTICGAGESEREGPDSLEPRWATGSHPNTDASTEEASGEGGIAGGF